MDYLWSPWRYQYVSKSAPPLGCIFCVASSEHRDKEHFIVHRGEHNFVILNRYPYSTGHLMIAPYVHIATLEATPQPAIHEMMQLAREAEIRLREAYRAQGLNLIKSASTAKLKIELTNACTLLAAIGVPAVTMRSTKAITSRRSSVV